MARAADPSGERPDRATRLSRLARGLAHEIKNPLSTMSINLALLQEDWERAAQTRNPASPELTPREERSLRRIKTLQREVLRLEGILDSFLHYARGDEVERTPQDIGALVRDLLDFVEPENEAEGIRQHVEVQGGLPLVLMDEAQVRQLFLNLLVNARQAMPEGGELLVRVRRVGNAAEVSVTDTGVGMSVEQAESCFDEYWSNKKGGTGLGLATARRIVREHGGDIDLVTEEGRGTSFLVMLPLAVELAGAGRDEEEAVAGAAEVSYEVKDAEPEEGSE